MGVVGWRRRCCCCPVADGEGPSGWGWLMLTSGVAMCCGGKALDDLRVWVLDQRGVLVLQANTINWCAPRTTIDVMRLG